MNTVMLSSMPKAESKRWQQQSSSTAVDPVFIAPFAPPAGIPEYTPGAVDIQIRLECWILNSLHPHQLDVLQPLPVVVTRLGPGNFVASFAPANVNASGDSSEEAVENLKDMIAAKYEYFSRLSNRLGPMPRKELAVLGQYIWKRR
jgi:hypothetical protein